MPIAAPLKEIAKLVPGCPPYNADGREVIEVATPGASDVLPNALRVHVDAGNAIFLLDGNLVATGILDVLKHFHL